MRFLAGIAIVLAVHAATYGLVGLLPDAAIVALGITAGNAEAIAEYWSARPMPSYPDSLVALFRGDLGTSLDHVPVLAELARAMPVSGFWIITCVLAGAALTICLSDPRRTVPRRSLSTAETLAFVPPFVFPFLLAPLLFATPYAGSEWAARLALAVCLVVPVTAMATSILLRHFVEEQTAPYTHALALNGIKAADINHVARQAAGARVLEAGDRAVVLAFVCVMLAEPLLGLPGIGTLAARAVRAADPSLTIGVTTCVATVVVIAGWASQGVRAWYASYSPRS